MEFDSPLDRLWHEYSLAFRDFDDLTLARWLAQTLGQLQGNIWRLSHPLVGSYRIAARLGHERQIWLKRLVNFPGAYAEAECCRAPLLPLLTRTVLESGLICEHCGGTAVALDDLAPEVQPRICQWAKEYADVHAVAHWDESKQRTVADYEETLDDAAAQAESMLAYAGQDLAPRLLDFYPAVIWEDQDECLDVRPENIVL